MHIYILLDTYVLESDFEVPTTCRCTETPGTCKAESHSAKVSDAGPKMHSFDCIKFFKTFMSYVLSGQKTLIVRCLIGIHRHATYLLQIRNL